MPRLPLSPEAARNIAAYLLLWAGRTKDLPAPPPPTAEEIDAVLTRLNVKTAAATGAALLRTKRCAGCHPGLDAAPVVDVPWRQEPREHGCLSPKGLPHFSLEAGTGDDLLAYMKVAGRDKHPSPFAERQRCSSKRAVSAVTSATAIGRPPSKLWAARSAELSSRWFPTSVRRV